MRAVFQVLTKDAALTTKNAEHMRNQLVYGIRTGVSGLLDVARATYVESIADINRECDNLKATYPQLQQLKLVFASQRCVLPNGAC
jgi:hypothetical protein